MSPCSAARRTSATSRAMSSTLAASRSVLMRPARRQQAVDRSLLADPRRAADRPALASGRRAASRSAAPGRARSGADATASHARAARTPPRLRKRASTPPRTGMPWWRSSTCTGARAALTRDSTATSPGALPAGDEAGDVVGGARSGIALAGEHLQRAGLVDGIGRRPDDLRHAYGVAGEQVGRGGDHRRRAAVVDLQRVGAGAREDLRRTARATRVWPRRSRRWSGRRRRRRTPSRPVRPAAGAAGGARA